VVIVGTDEERIRLRLALPEAVHVVGEAPTIAAARIFDADAIVVAPAVHDDDRPRRDGDRWEWTARDDDDDVPGKGARETLTPREIEVLELLAQGLANKTIAARLGISDQTVKFHVGSICGKLGVPNRTAAARLALRRGLIAL